jgi:CRISPR-associated endonuclease Cas1
MDLGADDLDWVSRSALWEGQARRRPSGYSPKRRRRIDPLVLCGYGVSLRVESDALVARSGFTHYPQEREELRFFKGDLNLPRRIIVVDAKGSISLRVLSWLAAQGVDLVCIDWRGEAVCAIAGAGRAVNPDRLREQLGWRADPVKRIAWCSDLIARKIESSQTTLLSALPPTEARQRALDEAERALVRLRSSRVQTVRDILLIEAAAASVYFKAWRGLPIRWRSTKQSPIPQTWMKVGPRNAPTGTMSLSNRNATHPLNAMLNYAYGVLHAHIQIQVLSSGFDPKRGILHETRDDALAFVLDMMEPFRSIEGGRHCYLCFLWIVVGRHSCFQKLSEHSRGVKYADAVSKPRMRRAGEHQVRKTELLDSTKTLEWATPQ